MSRRSSNGFWISSGSVHFWSNHESELNRSRNVIMQIQKWLVGWNEIVQSTNEDTFESHIAVYEYSIYKNMFQHLQLFFKVKNIDVVWYEEDENEIAF
jgi:hypothetical protein